MLVQGANSATSAAAPPVAIEIAYATLRAAIYDTNSPGSWDSVKALRRPVAPAATTRAGFMPGEFNFICETNVLTKAACAAETNSAPPIV
jgi:hypothetical protein